MTRGLLGKLRSLFRKKPESGLPRQPGLAGKRPGKVVGHRGIAAGSLKEGEQDRSPENVAQWETVSGDEVEAFIYKGKLLKVHSSNVDSAMYHIDRKKLVLVFKSGGVYEYGNVSEQEAINFAKALSKGGFVWDSLRVRGSATAHKKPYRRVG